MQEAAIEKPVASPVKIKSKTFSLKKVITKRKEEEIASQSESKEQLTNAFSLQEMLKYWEQFSNKIKGEGKESLYSILTKNQPQLKENFVIRLEIDNNFQLEELNNCKSNLTLFLRQKLANDTISLTSEIIDKPQEKKLYTNKDKYQRLVSINPKLELLKQKLNLDID